MIRSLFTGATGMQAQQLNLDVIANNMANVNTTGFKKSRAEFQDLLYQTLRVPGAETGTGEQMPTGIQVGLGVRPTAVQKDFSQGDFRKTDGPLDLVIEGRGFFQVLQSDGEIAYTRAGAFKLDSDGNIVTADGLALEPSISIPADAESIFIAADGTVSVTQPGSNSPTQVGQIELARFANPAGLMAIGNNLFAETDASGDAITATPGEDGLGTVGQGFLETSNVAVVDEMVKMIVSQRAYELNSKVVQASDEILQMANNMRR